MYEITKSDLSKGRKLKVAAIASPLILTVIPALITLILLLVGVSSPPVAAVIFFFGLLVTAIGFVVGLTATGIFLHRHSTWTKEMRELIAADGIRAEEINWFRHELKSSEKRALKAVEARDLVLGDAYRDALASRLTATRIVRSSKRELLLAKRRQNSLKQLKSEKADDFRAETASDIEKITKINDEAKLMLTESEARLQMIEAAAIRGGTLADSELALKKLSARASQLPLALESAKMADEIRKEIEAEPIDPALELDAEK